MYLKLFEVRDRMTCIPCFAFLTAPGTIHPNNAAEEFLLARAGFDPDLGYVIFGSLEEPRRSHYDPYDWPMSPRTMRQAHIYITNNWHALESGDVVDVEFVLGETQQPKTTERK